jgi:hypothetical protein
VQVLAIVVSEADAMLCEVQSALAKQEEKMASYAHQQQQVKIN